MTTILSRPQSEYNSCIAEQLTQPTPKNQDVAPVDIDQHFPNPDAGLAHIC